MNKLYPSVCCVIVMLFSLLTANAQVEYKPGYAILNDGTRISGLISINNGSPWYNQRYMRLKDSLELTTKAEKDVKSKKVKVEDLKFYQVGDRKFDKVHYVDVENLQLKSLGANDHMMERVATGKIDAHRYYSYPSDFKVYSGTSKQEVDEEVQKDHDDLVHGYKILVTKQGDDKLRNAFDYDMQKYFEDTPDVLLKYQKGEYGNQPIVKKSGLAARMIAMAKKATFKTEEADGIAAAINDYNNKNIAK